MMRHKTIHQVWIGPEMPEEEIGYAHSFREHNPEWSHFLWTDHPENFKNGPWTEVHTPPESHLSQILPTLKQRCSDKVYPAMLSDIIRLDVLANFGGVYFDTDVYCVRHLDFGEACLGLAWEYSNHAIGNSMIFAEKGHPAIYKALSAIYFKVKAVYLRGGEFQPVPMTGPLIIRETVASHPDCVVYPYEVFSPFNPSNVPADKTDWLEQVRAMKWSRQTMAVHMFASKWTDLERYDGDGLRLEWS